MQSQGWSKVVLCASLLPLCAVVSAQELHLLPQPREIKQTQSSFPVGAQTRIVVARTHAAEDTGAAETLAEEIASYTGRKSTITVAPAMPAVMHNVIYLARWEDDSRVRTLLAAQGLKNFDQRLDEEGYLLLADDSKVIIAGGGGAGLFYGVQTLRTTTDPSARRASDVPGGGDPRLAGDAVARRPRRRQPRTGAYARATEARGARTLSEYKINLFSLYMENVFDTQSEPLIPPAEGKLTAAEIKELVAYAARYHVTVMPEQQAFGHLHHILKYERYSDLAETPHGHVLAPVQEKSYELIANLYAEIAPLFPGPLFHKP
jgi:hexosaminidase